MTQRFHAPPGWDVPRDFVPPAGWQPDPSWPAAPADWTWWVDDGAPTSVPDASAPPSPQPAPSGQPAPYGQASPGGQSAPYSQSAPAGQPAPYGQPASPGQPATPYLQGGPSAQTAQAQMQVKGATRTIVIGAGIVVVGIVVNLVSFLNPSSDGTFRVWFLFPVFGLIIAIRGAVERSKWSKVAQSSADPAAFGAPGPTVQGWGQGAPPGPPPSGYPPHPGDSPHGYGGQPAPGQGPPAR